MYYFTADAGLVLLYGKTLPSSVDIMHYSSEEIEIQRACVGM